MGGMLGRKTAPSSPSTTTMEAAPEDGAGVSALCFVSDLLPTIAAYLDPVDALALDACGKETRCVALAAPVLVSGEPRSWHGSLDGYEAKEWLELPRFDRAHSCAIAFLWKDQGWGNRKGMLSVVEEGGKAPGDYAQWAPEVVAGLEPAPHELTRDVVSFRVRPGVRSYRLWVRVGGGGGHSLSVIKVQATVLAFR